MKCIIEFKCTADKEPCKEESGPWPCFYNQFGQCKNPFARFNAVKKYLQTEAASRDFNTDKPLEHVDGIIRQLEDDEIDRIDE